MPPGPAATGRSARPARFERSLIDLNVLVQRLEIIVLGGRVLCPSGEESGLWLHRESDWLVPGHPRGVHVDMRLRLDVENNREMRAWRRDLISEIGRDAEMRRRRPGDRRIDRPSEPGQARPSE